MFIKRDALDVKDGCTGIELTPGELEQIFRKKDRQYSIEDLAAVACHEIEYYKEIGSGEFPDDYAQKFAEEFVDEYVEELEEDDSYCDARWAIGEWFVGKKLKELGLI